MLYNDDQLELISHLTSIQYGLAKNPYFISSYILISYSLGPIYTIEKLGKKMFIYEIFKIILNNLEKHIFEKI